jgi:hypothetical protein
VILGSALKHDIEEADIEHAMRVPFRTVEREHDGREQTLVIGADRTGRLLELLYEMSDQGPVVFHAMELRPTFYRYV